MNPLLEINPAACLFVMGPQLSHKGARNSAASTRSDATETKQQTPSFSPSRVFPPATYNSILEAGLSFLNTKLSERENSVELAQIKRIASEEGPTKAMERLLGLMKRKSCFDEWLKSTFGGAERNQSFINSNADKNFIEVQDCHTATTSCSSQVATMNPTLMEIGSFQHLLSLQRQGALLACTQYDTILDSIAGTRPLTLHDTETLKQWSKLSTLPAETVLLQGNMQRKQQQHPVGILHLHGVCTDPSNVRFTDYQRPKEEEERVSEELVDQQASVHGRKPIPMSSLSEDFGSITPGMDILREIFRKRLVIFVGYDRDYFDPLLPGLLQTLYPNNEPGSLKNPPILLTSMPLTRQLSVGKELPSTFLTLMVTEEEMHNLSTVISSGSPKNFTVGKGLTDKQASDGLKVQAFLLFNEKQSFRKLGDIIYQQSKSGEIYVRRDALTVIFDDNKILYGNLVTYGGNGLRQLWKLVFSEGSTLLGKGLMALGLQNAAIIWTNRKPAELGNVTGINSVHTYAAHKAVHTMALAQQQYSSSNSVIQSAAPSSIVVMENNTTTPHRTVVTSNSQQLSSQTNPTLQQIAAGPALASASKNHESSNERKGGRSRDHSREREERGEGRARKGKEKREDVSVPTMISTSCSESSPIKRQIAASSSPKAEIAQPVVTAAATPQTTVAASIPPNFLLPGTTALTSPPMTSSAMPLGGLNLSALPSAPLTIGALSNQLLAGLPAAAITPTGISTPTGLLSPILLGNNPFLTLLGSSPNLSAAAAAASQPVPAAASILQATPSASLSQAVTGGANLSGTNLQLIKQLQEKINAHLQAIPSSQRGNIGSTSMFAAATSSGSGRTPLQQALLGSGFDQELSKRERLLESLLMSKTPIYCIASPPEVLVSDALSSEYTIECIDTQKRASSSRDSNETDGRCSENEPIRVSGSGDSNQRETAKEDRSGQSSRPAASQNLLNLMFTKTTEAKLATSLIKDSAGSISNNTHLLASPSLTIARSSLSNTTPTLSSQAAAAAGETPSVLSRLSLNVNPPSSFSLPATAQIQQAGLPLLNYAAAVPPATAPTLSSPLKGYYIMLNPLATAAAGVAAAGGATAVQPIMIAAAAGGTVAASPTVCGSTTAVQVPALTAAANLNLPSLATSLSSSAVPLPMYCYLPAATAADGSYHHLTAASVNSALTAQAAAPLAATISGVVDSSEKDKELEKRLKSHGFSTSPQVSKAKKRLRNDVTGLSEAKRIRVDIEGTEVDTSEEEEAVECATVSESDDEGADKIPVYGGENCKLSGYKGHLQLWEFLLDLLLTPNHGSIIQWTGNEYEFNIVNPEAVVRLWGAHKNKPQMTYDKMSRSLRYYYSQGIMDKVPGKRYTFKFAFDIQKYIIDNKKTSLFTLTS